MTHMFNKIKTFLGSTKFLNFGHKGGTLALALVLLFGVTAPLTLTGCNAASDVQKVLALLPTVEAIANTVANVVVAVDPGIGAPVKLALTTIEASFTEIQAIITAYQNNLAGMPDTVLAQLDALIAAVSSQLSSIEALFPSLPPVVVAGISAGLGAFQTILTLVAALIPASAAKQFPHAFASLSARGVHFGVSTGVVIPSARQLAKAYNAKERALGFSNAQVSVPFPRVLGIPVPVPPRM